MGNYVTRTPPGSTLNCDKNTQSQCSLVRLQSFAGWSSSDEILHLEWMLKKVEL